MKYLHETSPGIFWLDHRLVPEVRAMFAAMSSRAPVGGIKARYLQIVEAVVADLWETQNAVALKELGVPTLKAALDSEEIIYHPGGDSPDPESPNHISNDPPIFLDEFAAHTSCILWEPAENRLCEYPLHPKVQKFFDDFVGKYGHSSIMELTGEPAVYAEGISWYTAWLLFDSPICAGQEFSTRAVQHKDWPMARECAQVVEGSITNLVGNTATLEGGERVDFTPVVPVGVGVGERIRLTVPQDDLVALHNDWFEVFEAEVAWWKEHLATEANRLALGIGDKEPFRPALDRARWALPGTIATGCCHTGHLRERSRVLRDGLMLAQRSKSPSAIKVWEGIRAGYAEALPGLAGMGLREAVYGDQTQLPSHWEVGSAAPGAEVEVRVHDLNRTTSAPLNGRKAGSASYLDQQYNQTFRVDLAFRCSLAVARDWHRHRTMYPWKLDIVGDGELRIHPAYEAKSIWGQVKLPELLARSYRVYRQFKDAGDQMSAMLCLPLGTEVLLSGQGGLRDAVYLLELRYGAVGANFEYKAQARKALDLLTPQLHPELALHLGLQ